VKKQYVGRQRQSFSIFETNKGEKMKLIVFGPTGSTGRQVVTQALDQGHDVTAFARSPEKIDLKHEKLQVIAGS
jgi:short-subunit dehydrogenase